MSNSRMKYPPDVLSDIYLRAGDLIPVHIGETVGGGLVLGELDDRDDG